MAAVLGISAYFHDSGAALVVDGNILWAAQEERFSRIRHDSSFPARAIQACLDSTGMTPQDLDLVVFYEKPLRKFERILETALHVCPRGLAVFWEALPSWIHEKLHLPREMNRSLQGLYGRRFLFTQHHEAHAASAFFPSPFEEAAVLTVDGVGEWATTGIYRGSGCQIEPLAEIQFPHSLGLLYSAFTVYCGFRINSGEYKLMGLAPYGQPRFASIIEQELIDLKDDGSFCLNMKYFDYLGKLRTIGPAFEKLFGQPTLQPGQPPTQHTMDVAASIQSVLNRAMVALAKYARKLTGSRNLCLAGGVALNCVANSAIQNEAGFDRIWIQPAAGDAGGALGAALYVSHQLNQQPRPHLTNPAPVQISPQDGMNGSLLGSEATEEVILRSLESAKVPFVLCAGFGELCERVAELLDQGQIVGWYQGRMEFGPRALGSRSILADARHPGMQVRLNLETKFRESFRPFAPVVLEDQAPQWFDTQDGFESPYMLLTVPVAPHRRLPIQGLPPDAPMLDRLAQQRSTIPAVTHVDFSARVQTVGPRRHPHLHQLLETFFRRTDCPVLVNTSFNVRGEPIVCTPEDAIRCYLATGIDALALGNCLLIKTPDQRSPNQAQAHLARFAQD